MANVEWALSINNAEAREDSGSIESTLINDSLESRMTS
jgi:hypothetical protein